MIARVLRRRIACVTICFASILLGGCASSAPVRYYRLEAMALEARAPDAGAAVLAIGPVTFPDYLQRTQLVLRGDRAEMQMDELNRWAEPLDEAVPRILAANIGGLAESIVVASTIRPDYRLFATVHRLDADTAGDAVLAVQWGVTGDAGEIVLPPRTSRYHARVIPPGEPGAMAEAISGLLAQWSREIADALPAGL